MKNTIILFIISFFCISRIFAQNIPLDSIFTSEKLIIAKVKSVEPDVVTFTFPNEEVVTSIYKNTVRKIRFASGRTQIFTEALALKEIESGFDFDQVSITRLESETKGLIKLDEIFTKAVGTTVFSNITTVKERAFRKMKIQAAMSGGNLVYMLDQSTVGNQAGSAFQAGKATETILSGIVYTNNLPKIDYVKEVIKDNKFFQSFKITLIGRNSTDIEELDMSLSTIYIENIYEESGLVYVKAKVQRYSNEIFRVVFVENDVVTLMWKDGNKIYNVAFNPTPTQKPKGK